MTKLVIAQPILPSSAKWHSFKVKRMTLGVVLILATCGTLVHGVVPCMEAFDKADANADHKLDRDEYVNFLATLQGDPFSNDRFEDLLHSLQENYDQYLLVLSNIQGLHLKQDGQSVPSGLNDVVEEFCLKIMLSNGIQAARNQARSFRPTTAQEPKTLAFLDTSLTSASERQLGDARRMLEEASDTPRRTLRNQENIFGPAMRKYTAVGARSEQAILRQDDVVDPKKNAGIPRIPPSISNGPPVATGTAAVSRSNSQSTGISLQSSSSPSHGPSNQPSEMLSIIKPSNVPSAQIISPSCSPSHSNSPSSAHDDISGGHPQIPLNRQGESSLPSSSSRPSDYLSPLSSNNPTQSGVPSSSLYPSQSPTKSQEPSDHDSLLLRIQGSTAKPSDRKNSIAPSSNPSASYYPTPTLNQSVLPSPTQSTTNKFSISQKPSSRNVYPTTSIIPSLGPSSSPSKGMTPPSLGPSLIPSQVKDLVPSVGSLSGSKGTAPSIRMNVMPVQYPATSQMPSLWEQELPLPSYSPSQDPSHISVNRAASNRPSQSFYPTAGSSTTESVYPTTSIIPSLGPSSSPSKSMTPPSLGPSLMPSQVKDLVPSVGSLSGSKGTAPSIRMNVMPVQYPTTSQMPSLREQEFPLPSYSPSQGPSHISVNRAASNRPSQSFYPTAGSSTTESVYPTTSIIPSLGPSSSPSKSMTPPSLGPSLMPSQVKDLVPSVALCLVQRELLPASE
ncbi:expressed unknown protein [Seminavis robusta]|uniref:EF-hand domain-containing protein n=1 Tax=Seminavis robusta TaxID=568900 RepID=A0A9N8DAQ9_9STRA|nr:expressed unknown protein [Seminavis robusta]|eukprot:Sro17_g012470.1 n/a (729) ;mRNA; f:114115-116301